MHTFTGSFPLACSRAVCWPVMARNVEVTVVLALLGRFCFAQMLPHFLPTCRGKFEIPNRTLRSLRIRESVDDFTICVDLEVVFS